MNKTIEVEGLVKDFSVTIRKPGFRGAISTIISPEKKTIKALKGVSFTVSEGELVGFIGPNGAGKTTTLKILSGILHKTNGVAQVLGENPEKRDSNFLKKIALVMGSKNQLWWDLPAIETFELNRAIYEIPKNKYKKTLDELVDLLSLGKILNIQVRRLSLGQRMRLELVAALLHSPEVIFLDEPTIGLDVIAQQKLRDFIAAYNKKNKATILLTSHNMDDVLMLAKRVIVINEGIIIFDGLLADLSSRFSKNKIIKVYSDERIEKSRFKGLGKLISVKHPEYVLSIPKNKAAGTASILLQNLPVDDLTIEEEPLDAIIRKVFKG